MPNFRFIINLNFGFAEEFFFSWRCVFLLHKLNHGIHLDVPCNQSKTSKRKFRKWPQSTEILADKPLCMQHIAVLWLAKSMRVTRARQGKLSRDTSLVLHHLHTLQLFTFSCCFSFPEYDRFHHAKDFTYNYEGETVSSIAGASSARSGLRIRARCVVKSVAPCQHVLKVG